MPKYPPDLPRLLPSPDPFQRVQVQQTAFTDDVLGRYICNDWADVKASLADGGFPFDAVVVGAGMFGGYCAEKLYRLGAGVGLRILVLEAGAFVLPSHIQNLPPIGGNVGNAPGVRTTDDGVRNVVWGMPWISDTTVATSTKPPGFPGLAYCVGGRSLFWGGWSPELTAADLADPAWPADVAAYLTTPVPGDPRGWSGYQRTAQEIGTATTTDYMLATQFHGTLRADLDTAVAGLPVLTSPVEEAPLAVQGSAPASGLFAFDKFSSAPASIDAIRNDVAVNTTRGDVSRRIFLVPRTQVLRLNVVSGAVTSIDLSSDGIRDTLRIPAGCAVVLANGTIEATRLALESLGVGDTRFGAARLGNLMAHLRSNITVRIKRSALGLPPNPLPQDLETTAFLVRGASGGRRFHFQVVAAAVGTQNPEQNLFQQVPDIDTIEQMRANRDPNWIAFVFRGIGEMAGDRSLAPSPAANWIDLSPETDPLFGKRRAFVRLGLTGTDVALWQTMDTAAFDLAEKLASGAGAAAGNIEYLVNGQWVGQRPAVDPTNGGPWRDALGTTHHEAGTLFMGAPGSSITNSVGRFHDIANTYVAGPALFPTIGSANPSLTGLTLARRTATAIISARAPSGFTPLSLDPADWTMLAAAGSNPAIARLGSILETSGGYGLYCYTKQEFGDFSLWLEWREAAAGNNCGVYIRIPDPTSADALRQADLQGHEIQIDDLGAGNPPGQGIHRTGAIYGLQAATSIPTVPPGEWNTYLIEAAGPQIRVNLNGQLINNYTSNRQLTGFVALQVHGYPSAVAFRNLRIGP
jgi:hypothetical protein